MPPPPDPRTTPAPPAPALSARPASTCTGTGTDGAGTDDAGTDTARSPYGGSTPSGDTPPGHGSVGDAKSGHGSVGNAPPGHAPPNSALPGHTPKRDPPGRLRTWLPPLAGAAILALLLSRLGTSAVTEGLTRVTPAAVFAALALGAFTTVLSAWRWRLVARALGLGLPLGRAVADYYGALFLNSVLPGGIVGDVDRAVRHGRGNGDLGRGVWAVVLERTAGQFVLLAVAAVVLTAFPSPVADHARRALTGPWTAAVLAVGCGATALVVALRARAAARADGRPAAPAGTHGAVRATSAAPATPATPALADRRALYGRRTAPAVLGVSVAVLAGHLVLFWLAARVSGVTAPFAVLLPLMVLALLAMSVPLNIGGWGPREGVTAWAFGAAGLGAAQGLTVSVLYGVLAVVAALPGALVLAARWCARPGRSPRRPLRVREVQLEEGVLPEPGAPQRGTPCLAHHVRPVEPQPGHPVPEQHRRDRDVQPPQGAAVQEAGDGDPAALDEHPAEPPVRQRGHQPAGCERVVVRQPQHGHPVGDGPPGAAAGAHQPQGGR